MNGYTEKTKIDEKHLLRGGQGREVKWLFLSAAASMTISLIYLAYRTKLVCSFGVTTFPIWAALAIEIATAGKRAIVQSSPSSTRQILFSSSFVFSAINFW